MITRGRQLMQNYAGNTSCNRIIEENCLQVINSFLLVHYFEKGIDNESDTLLSNLGM